MDEQQVRKLVEQTKKSAGTVGESASRQMRRSSEERLRQAEADYRNTCPNGPVPDNLIGGGK